jgi:chemotaxis protein CheC
MTDEVDELTDIEQDALAEIANMGVSRAANSLRQMFGEEVLLSVPAVKIVTRQAASKLVERNNATKLVAVQQSFEGPFAGRALLIFPEAQSLELVRAIVGDEHSLEDVIDLEQEALAETGNIILNGCLAAMERSCSRLTKRVQEDSLSCSCISILISRSATFTASSRSSWICRRSPH